ncbi:hypothetical protein GWI33_018057 [Rhynchophorus ferrugineus]|uniref:Uncharacterized protein n=1 Tax=Rhynchophorus ferrugineus TaxID=354439 RepID=A0A834M5N9_RHYFE|nr:hypothetical protein GWI33_018057 [Rhynchophorus ferrugineus]
MNDAPVDRRYDYVQVYQFLLIRGFVEPQRDWLALNSPPVIIDGGSCEVRRLVVDNSMEICRIAMALIFVLSGRGWK